MLELELELDVVVVVGCEELEVLVDSGELLLFLLSLDAELDEMMATIGEVGWTFTAFWLTDNVELGLVEFSLVVEFKVST